jgi:hypothetical protein
MTKKTITFNIKSNTFGTLCIILCLILLGPSLLFTALFLYSSGPNNPPVLAYFFMYSIPFVISFLIWIGVIKANRWLIIIAFILLIPFILSFVYGNYQFRQIPPMNFDPNLYGLQFFKIT